MNYFERLVRRARQRARDDPGSALFDPFESVADWPLDGLVTAPTPTPASPSDEISRVETLTREIVAPGAARAAGNAAPRAAPELLAAPATLLSARPPAASAPPRVEVAAAPVVPTAATPQTPPAPLELADRFLRTLGVPVPAPLGTAPAEPTAEPVRQSRDPERAPAVAAVPASRIRALLPPVPPPIHIVPEATKHTGSHGRVDAATGASVERPSSPPAPRVIERREVIVLERSAATRREGAIAGGGAPRFGLGQL